MRSGSTSIALAAAVALGLAALATASLAGTAGGEESASSRTAVVVNESSPESLAIGELYRAAHGIPESQVLRIRWPRAEPGLGSRRHELISRTGFERHVRDPIRRQLAERGLTRHVHVLVTTKGVPLRIAGDDVPPELALRDDRGASVDAELALLGSGLDGGAGGLPNPYYGRDLSFEAFRTAYPDAPLRYIVGRLTGYQLAADRADAADAGVDLESGVPPDVRGLVENARAASPASGVWVVDLDPAQPVGRRCGNEALLASAAAALRVLGKPVVVEPTREVAADASDIVGYASWGSNARDSREAPFYGPLAGHLVPGRFAPRSVAVPLVSTNGRTFTAPAAYGQSLAADLVRLGAAGVAAHVREPTLSAVARPAILLSAYARGAPAGEAFFRSLPFLGWTNLWIGDPWMRLADAETDPPADRDGDGYADRDDNCSEIPNEDQRDTDGDGFGNVCDGDVDGDGRVTSSWGVRPPGDVERIGLTAYRGLYHPDHDLDGDGDVDGDDVTQASLRLLHAPGPSGPASRGDGAAPKGLP